MDDIGQAPLQAPKITSEMSKVDDENVLAMSSEMWLSRAFNRLIHRDTGYYYERGHMPNPRTLAERLTQSSDTWANQLIQIFNEA